MADSTDKSKGQEFVSQRNLKNQLFGKRKEGEGALNKTMSSFSTKSAKVFSSLDKSIKDLNKNITQLVKPTQKKKDFVRRDDPMKKLSNNFGSVVNLLEESNKMQKDSQKGKKKGVLGMMGILGGLGAGLAGAGLIGYLLTGKKEFLNNITKSITKYMPTKIFFKIFDKGLKFVLGKGAKLFAPLLKNFGGGILSKSGKLLKPITKLFKGFSKLFSPLTKILGKAGKKFGGKGAAKVAGKLGLKALKGVPVIGTILGTYFAIQRWKKGDKAGAMMEMASGLLSNIPFAGFAADALILLRDFIGPKKVDAFMGGAAKGAGKVLGKIGMAVLRQTPGIGTMMRFMDGLKLWKTNKVGALIEFGGALSTIVPGGGMIFDTVISIAKMFSKSDIKKNAVDETKKFVANVKEHPVQATTQLFAKGAGKMAEGAKKAPGKMFNWAKQKAKGALSSASSSMMEALYEKAQPDAKQRGVEEIAGKRGDGWYTYKPWKPIVNRLNPAVWKKFQGMAGEYFTKTGDLVQINSAYRNQKGSVHGAGFAMDINSNDANALESAGLMEKWGFHRPLINWKKKESWHMEPYPGKNYGKRNTNNYPIRSAVAQGKAKFEVGGDNLPSSPIENEGLKNSSTLTKIDLSESTIQSLANAMGVSFKGAMPKGKSAANGANIAMRG